MNKDILSGGLGSPYSNFVILKNIERKIRNLSCNICHAENIERGFL